jgi:hypothetical protein
LKEDKTVAETEEKVTLVALESFSPYKKDDVFTVSKKEASAVLSPNLRDSDFGPIYPNVKVRLYDPESDVHLLLKGGSLNQKERDTLEAKISAAVKTK